MSARWCALLCLAGLLIAGGCRREVSNYEPFSANGAIIYHEACARCHDEGVDAPLLLRGDVRNLDGPKIEEALASGRSGMPSYPLIEGEYREALVQFILQRQDPAVP